MSSKIDYKFINLERNVNVHTVEWVLRWSVGVGVMVMNVDL